LRKLYLSLESALVPLLNDEPKGTNLTTAGVLAFSAASVESSFFASSSLELFGADIKKILAFRYYISSGGRF
jgi:hypothetical protein